MIAKIVLFKNLRKIFDYTVPSTLSTSICIGIRVKIPFGKQQKIGFIVQITEDPSIIEPIKLKSILEIVDPTPLLPIDLYNTLLWAANYYKSSLGGILDCALPKYIKDNKPLVISENSKKNATTLVQPESTTATVKLNRNQQLIIEQILELSNQFNVHILEGVTGSGKTEVYLQLTAAMLQQDRQILILIPEIGLTPQTWERFTNRFKGVCCVILHSKLTPKQRAINWEIARSGQAKIIIGTRAAAFIPLADPGLFIIDEEHDTSFKQQDQITYHARDLLIIRAKYANCPILLGSATPSLETIYNVMNRKYLHYRLPERAISALPQIEIIDIRHKKLIEGLSSVTINTINQHLMDQQQVLVFINRRGFAPVLQCNNCKVIQICNDCDANLIWHIYTNKLHCHHCHKISPVPTKCANCNSSALQPIGQGTEKIEQLFNSLFPDARIARIDKDSTKKKPQFEQILTGILEQKFNLLVGTQMIAKGHHFPNLSLVVIIDLDHGLFSTDFRTTERLGQLILQVAGRAGREKLGRVLLETAHPTNPLLLAIQNYDYNKFCELLLQERYQAGLPPFAHQILWKVEAATMGAGLNFLNQVKLLANKQLDLLLAPKNKINILGPIPAIMEKKKKKYHSRLLFQGQDRNILQKLQDYLIQELASLLGNKPSIKWKIDVDPKEI